MSKTKEHRLPGEFDLRVIDCGNSTVRSSLNHYYAVGGNKNGSGIFQGKILKQENGWTLLKHLTVRFADIDMHYVIHDVIGVEDHIWIFDDNIFKKYNVGDDIEFNAKVYAYHRNPAKHNGEISIDFSLKDIKNIKIINGYDYPPKDMQDNQEEWRQNFIEEIVCETCLYSSQCYGEPCLAPDGYKEDMINALMQSI